MTGLVKYIRIAQLNGGYSICAEAHGTPMTQGLLELKRKERRDLTRVLAPGPSATAKTQD